MIKTIFAVDPGVVSGWAVMTVEAEPQIDGIPDKLNFTHKSLDLKRIPSEVLLPKSIMANSFGIKMLVAIEGQYLDEGKRKNVDSLIKLARKAGRWEEAACAHGLSYEYIQPSVWITAELGHGLQRDQIAVLAKQKCEALYRLNGLSEHEYCAILIGRYVAIREWRKGLGK